MYAQLKGYKTPSEFAKEYKAAGGVIGVRRQYIYQLIREEKASPGSTGIDVLEIDKRLFVRYDDNKKGA